MYFFPMESVDHFEPPRLIDPKRGVNSTIPVSAAAAFRLPDGWAPPLCGSKKPFVCKIYTFPRSLQQPKRRSDDALGARD